MKRITVALCALALLSSAAFAQKADKDKAKSKDKDKALVSVSNKQTSPMPDSAAMMQNWMAYMTPGKAHEMMAKTDGTWDGDITMWMEPGGQPMKSTGTAVNKMILGGRYQHSVHTGSFMGQPFEGINTLAYDNAKKVYITTWIDNMGTGIMQAEGTWDPAIKGIVFKGKMVDPSKGDGSECNFRQVVRFIDDDHQMMEMYGPAPDGTEFKTMEIKMTRKK